MSGDLTGPLGGHRLAGLLKTHAILLAAVIAVGLGVVLLAPQEAVRVGDGSEYYAMFLAWRDTLRPFLTDPAWQAYQRLYDAHSIAHLQPLADLRGMFPALDTGHSVDLNHFWFYSAAAASVSCVASTFGLVLSPQASFVMLQWILATLALSIAWSTYRGRGLVAASMLLFLSPAIWYIDKVHTEFFTITLTLSATILFVRRRFLIAAFLLALASTQNISFIAVAAVVLVIDFAKRPAPRRYGLAGAIVLFATVVVMLAHPTYYFFRLGIVTPQLLAGGASVGLHLGSAGLWFFDPDLGLLTNWPFAVVIAGIAMVAQRRPSGQTGSAAPSLVLATRGELVAYYVGYLFFSLLAQSSTVNLNSAATPGLARYGLWYMSLFFPPFLIAADWTMRGLRGGGTTRARAMLWRRLAAAALAIVTAVYTFAFFRPSIPEDGPALGAWHPSWLSWAVQAWAPQLYDPPVEVFAERYGGIAESPRLAEAMAIVGPDCRKMLVQSLDKTVVLGGANCGYVDGRLRDVLGTLADKDAPGFHYVRLTDQQARRAQIPLMLGTWYPIGTDSVVNGVLGKGWNDVESWGVWSATSRAQLSFPCSNVEKARTLTLGMRAFLTGPRTLRHVEIRLDDDVAAAIDFHAGDPAETPIAIALSKKSCNGGMRFVTIYTADPESPSALGISDDQRPLGVALLRFRFDP